MKLLIIGSEGFIGSNAVLYFRQRNYEVHCADIILKEAENYTAINPEFPDFGRLFYKKIFDLCINASGTANVQFSFKQVAMDYSLNTSNVYHILEAIKQFNPNCKFINFSSAAVYGNPQYLPIDEMHPIKPLSPYGWHKYYSELICKEFHEYYHMFTISLRVFSTYGPGLKKQLFWDLFQKSKQLNIELFGTGNETRDFIYINDLLKAIELIIHNYRFDGACINVANGMQLKIKDVMQLFLKILNWEGQYIFKGENRLGDPSNWEANVEIIKQLGYQQSISIEQGLKNYIEWAKENV